MGADLGMATPNSPQRVFPRMSMQELTRSERSRWTTSALAIGEMARDFAHYTWTMDFTAPIEVRVA